DESLLENLQAFRRSARSNRVRKLVDMNVVGHPEQGARFISFGVVDRQGNVFQIRMRLEGRLEDDADLSRLHLTAPGYFRRLPGGAKAIDLTAFNREPGLGAALVTLDHVERQAEGSFEQLGDIAPALTPCT